MSGTTDKQDCPKCNGHNLMTSSDWKPFDWVCGECLDCGFMYYTKDDERLSLEEVNSIRKDYGLKPLKRLKKGK